MTDDHVTDDHVTDDHVTDDRCASADDDANVADPHQYVDDSGASDAPVRSHPEPDQQPERGEAMGPVTLGAAPLDGIVRRVRRLADMSQRELAAAARTSPATIAGIENGTRVPSLAVLQRILSVAGCELAAVDGERRTLAPLAVWDDVRDLAGRRFPAHLDTILDPAFGEWWADRYGLAKPPETFRRDRAVRDYERRRSQWEVRVEQFRLDPPPLPPRRPRSA